MGNALRQRYETDVEEAIEDLPIQRKVEMYQDLQRQAALLKDLEEQLVRSLEAMADEEKVLREREDFLELRRKAYMKRLDPSIVEEDDSDDDDDDDEEGQQEEQQPSEQESSGVTDENMPARANVAPEEAAAASLGSIAVKDGPAEHKREELKAFLEQELPEIQRNVALRARTLWWKQKEYDDKLEDARSQLKEVQRLIEAIEPGIPSKVGGGEAGTTPSV